MISHTKQEWFDLAVRGLAGQGWKRSAGMKCLYGKPGGLRCAVGHGLGDVVIREGRMVSNLVADGTVGVSDAGRSTGSVFLGDMQHAHDGGHSPSFMRERFLALAEQYSLTWPADVPKEGAIQ
jgi:hypothetical protein